MSIEDFWHSDIELLQAYQTAYIRDVSYRSWAYGKEMVQSTLMALGLAFSTKKDENIQYQSWNDPLTAIQRKDIKMSSKEKERKFRSSMNDQTDFIHRLLHGNEER